MAGWSRLARYLWIALALAVCAPASALETETIQRIRDATFEVVMKKPRKDSLSYEKPLPMNLVPFAVRNDDYIPMGTAFAIAPNTFITAQHVLGVFQRTDFEGPFLRNQSGEVFGISEVRKLSVMRDFVVFSLERPPKGHAVLELNPEPRINEQVYAVGNAMGEGIVIRDGLFTSSTPEEMNGEWNWIRFSAAASPGNSGGPLVDRQGRVIGVILRKSESENLNYALPISEVSAAGEVADLGMPMMFKIDNADFSELGALDTQLQLPLPYPELHARATEEVERAGDELGQRMWRRNAEQTFPNGRGSETLLHTTHSAVFPRLIARASDGSWTVYRPDDVDRADIGDNGRIWHGRMRNAWYIRARKPDGMSLEEFLGNPRLFLDTLLKGIPLKRTVAGQEIRITSMGDPREDYVHVDSYGRKWQVRIWPNEYDDSQLVTFSTPVPGGSVTRMRWIYTRDLTGIVNDMKTLSDFAYLSYRGTLEQWRELLAHRELLPAAFDGIDVDIAYDERLAYRSERINLTYSPETMAITPESDLWLLFSYFREQGKTVWDVAQVIAGEHQHSETFVRVSRHIRPTEEMGDSARSAWDRITGHKVPYDRTAFFNDDSTLILSVFNDDTTTKPDLLYTITYGIDGNRPQDLLESKLDGFIKGVRVLEYGTERN